MKEMPQQAGTVVPARRPAMVPPANQILRHVGPLAAIRRSISCAHSRPLVATAAGATAEPKGPAPANTEGKQKDGNGNKEKDDKIYLKRPSSGGSSSRTTSDQTSVTMPMSFMTGSIIGKRFYNEENTRMAYDGNGWTVMLDYRTLKTPSKRPLKIPSLALAKAIAAEWEYQEEDGIRPFTMPLTKLACTAMERVPLTRATIIEHLIKKFHQDLVFCRSPGDSDLTSGVLGVIWKGDSLIDGVPETLDMLRSRGKRLVFVTNNSTKSRKQYGKKFETLGLNVGEEEIFASSFAAAAYLKSINFPKDKKVYVIGEDGILKELELAGFQYLGGPVDGEKKIELKPGFLMEHDEDVGAVVVGFDRYLNYYKIQYATLCIRENPRCLFLATNRDAVTHLTDAQEWAGGGSMVGAIWGSTKQEPLVVGKPSTFMMDYLANEFGILKSQICMVGDRLDTDILFGQNGGCKTLLVLSGVTTLDMLQSPNNSIKPDFYTNQISDMLAPKAAAV